MKIKQTSFLLFIMVLGLSSCYYDVEEELYPTGSSCDTSNVSFAKDIYPVFNSNCNLSGCHNSASNQAGFSFEGYDNLKKNIENTAVLGSIKHLAGFSQMPQSRSKLSSCTILKIEQWKNNGAPNN
ncbi:MAG: hypothetical protein H6605_06780 [Flavobacteriales bacterium]|nr:hypothetical protein [Flavobacteriales bacterium]